MQIHSACLHSTHRVATHAHAQVHTHTHSVRPVHRRGHARSLSLTRMHRLKGVSVWAHRNPPTDKYAHPNMNTHRMQEFGGWYSSEVCTTYLCEHSNKSSFMFLCTRCLCVYSSFWYVNVIYVCVYTFWIFPFMLQQIYMFFHVQVHLQTHICKYKFIHTLLYVCSCVCSHSNAYIHIHTHVAICVLMYMFTHKQICKYVYITSCFPCVHVHVHNHM